MKARQAIVALAALVVCTSAFAESTKGALSEFGLIGTWSDECSNNANGGLRLTFAAPFFGAPTLVMRGDQMTMTITEAVRVTDDKIAMVLDGDLIKGVKVVYQKVGSKLRLFETYPVAGATQTLIKNGMMGNMPEPLLEKCLN